MENKITELTKEWYKLISKEYHKDRDCHFTIQATYSYGEPAIYEVVHNGYILGDNILSAESFKDAEEQLILLLEEAIEEEKYWQEQEENECL